MKGLKIWVVYKNTTCNPGGYSGRLFYNDQPTGEHRHAKTHQEVIDWVFQSARSKLTFSLTHLPRSKGDDPTIVETYF